MSSDSSPESIQRPFLEALETQLGISNLEYAFDPPSKSHVPTNKGATSLIHYLHIVNEVVVQLPVVTPKRYNISTSMECVVRNCTGVFMRHILRDILGPAYGDYTRDIKLRIDNDKEGKLFLPYPSRYSSHTHDNC